CEVDPNGMWAVSRHDDAVAVLKDTQHFSSDVMAKPRPEWLEDHAFADATLLELDPPAHTKLRNLISASQAFRPPGLARLKPFVPLLAEDLAARLVGPDEVEFMREFAMPLPEAVMGHILGLDADSRSSIRPWSTATSLYFMGSRAKDEI